MQYATPSQIIEHFAEYKLGEKVILLHDIDLPDKTIPAPISCTVTDIKIINKKAEKHLPRCKESQINDMFADPDFLIYELSLPGNITVKTFAHALVHVNDFTKEFTKTNCENLYNARCCQFRYLMQSRRKLRIRASTSLSITLLCLLTFASILSFYLNMATCGTLFAVLAVILPLFSFAYHNRKIERIHMIKSRI